MIIEDKQLVPMDERRSPLRVPWEAFPNLNDYVAEGFKTHPVDPTAASMSSSCAITKALTPPGAIPAKVSERDRASVTAGFCLG